MNWFTPSMLTLVAASLLWGSQRWSTLQERVIFYRVLFGLIAAQLALIAYWAFDRFA